MKKRTKIILWALWSLFAFFWLSVALVITLISTGVIGYMPPISQLQNPIDKFASQLYSAEGESFGSYARSGANRVYVSYGDISPNVINALIATEDVRFEKHAGVDYKALARAVVKRGILHQSSGGGGSTITQQLAKMLYSPTASNVVVRLLQKPIEWVIATKIERYYTKEEIISMYLNQFDFLYNAVGIRSAAYIYFGKTTEELNQQEAATLIGMCKNPSVYNPVLFSTPERSIKRRNVVFSQMSKAKYLTKAEADSLSALPMEVSFHRMSHKEGTAPYFREHIRLMLSAKKPQREKYASWQYQEFKDDSLAWATNPIYGWCQKNGHDLYTEGLKIYTTLSLPMQEHAERAMQEHMEKNLQPLFDKELKNRTNPPFSNDLSKADREAILLRAMKQTDRWRNGKRDGLTEAQIIDSFHEKRKMTLWSWEGQKEATITPLDSIMYLKSLLRSGFVALNPHNGHVKAYVGGINFATFQYDMVSRGRRQVGSTIKPFLYSLSMTEGMTPCDMIPRVRPLLYTAAGKPWSPRGSGNGEMVSIQWGLQHSDNWITAHLMSRTSPMTFLRLLRSYGIMGEIEYPDVAMSMGTPEATVGEMASAYTTYVNKGIRMEMLPITRIEDRNGNVLATFTPRSNEVLSQDAALKMLTMLRAVVDGGTGGRLRYRHNLTMPLGGKTGTTQRNSDAWFVGFTPNLVAACWTGGEDRSIRFNSMTQGQGAAAALPIVGLFLKAVYTDKDLGYSIGETFEIPQGFSPCSGSLYNFTIGTDSLPDIIENMSDDNDVSFPIN